MYEYSDNSLLRIHNNRRPSQLLKNKILTKHLDAIGFNNRIKNKHIVKIMPLGNSIRAIDMAQKRLMQEIKDIDNSLQKKNHNLKYINGLLFGEGVNQQLLKSLQKILKNKIDCIENGFLIWKLIQSPEKQEYELISSRLMQSPKKFNELLMEKSIENLKQYDIQRQQQSIKKINKRWNNSIKVKRHDEDRFNRFKTQSSPLRQSHNISQFTNGDESGLISNHQVTSNTRNTKKMIISNRLPIIETGLAQMKKYSTKNVLMSAEYYNNQRRRKQQQKNEYPQRQQLIRMLNKEPSIVSIWLPPSSYPQLLGIISIQIKQSSNRIQQCYLKKYLLYKHGVNKKLFNAIFQWVRIKHPKIEHLSIITTKIQYNNIFMSYGWKGSSWINQQKLKIIYKQKY